MRGLFGRRVWDHGLFVGVPVKLGARGSEEIIEIKLPPEEKAALQKTRPGEGVGGGFGNLRKS